VLLVYPLFRYAVLRGGHRNGQSFSTHRENRSHYYYCRGRTDREASGRVDPQPLAVFGVPLWFWLPSTSLLSEDRFLTITLASLKQTVWIEHLATLVYGMDYALVFALIAMWSFHPRSLTLG
jgi:hypothetical protein